MKSEIVNIQFPEFTGVKCIMMPYIQGDISSLPDNYKSYFEILNDLYLEKGKIGYLTIDESFVNAGTSQRGYNGAGISRNVHIEVSRRENMNSWGGSYWGSGKGALLDDMTEVLIANSISDTCRIWDNVIEMRETPDGDLSAYINDYPETSGRLMKSGEVAKMRIFTPHECIAQKKSGNRQFIRIVGDGVTGREPYFTVNPKLT